MTPRSGNSRCVTDYVRYPDVSATATSEVRGADAADLRWQCADTGPQEIATPDHLHADLTWFTAQVPGTVAAALRDGHSLDIDRPPPLLERDFWYRTILSGDGPGLLRLHGLATLAEVWLDDALLLRSDNMFLGHDLRIELTGSHRLHLCFRALETHPPRPSRRSRWRPAMIPRRSLRSIRTSLLGHLPGWCPALPIVGPWRPIELLDLSECVIRHQALHATLSEDGSGWIAVRLTLDGPRPDTASVECAGVQHSLEPESDGTWSGRLTVQQVDRWWPHTHGDPRLYAVTVTLTASRKGARSFLLGHVGFRRIRIDRGEDGTDFAVYVNDVKIFCRGANWTSADLVSPPQDREALLPWVERMRDAHMNMVRVGGTTLYEATAFYELCDEYGILVWQDCMLANFDYPDDDAAFRYSIEAEVQQFLERTSASPSLAILCGGSEVAQQAAMLGLPPSAWSGPLFDDWIPAVAREIRPDLVYVLHSPSGGVLPFVTDAGVTHYYGVGAYRRPLEDARRARVRFATECLGFANVPEARLLRKHLADIGPLHPVWKQRTPRDIGVSWDFEDVREHYLEQLFAVDATALKHDDENRYLALSRAATAEIMETTVGEWRRSGSSCNGALVWTLQDLMPGAGWGVIDSTGDPKSTWYALRRAYRPTQVIMTDEGLNGLAIHCINDRPSSLRVRLEFACYSGKHVVASASTVVVLAPNSTMTFSAFSLLGQFFDVTYAYRFGSPSHEVCVAALFDAGSNALVADAFHFPQGPCAVRPVDVLDLQLDYNDNRWWLTVTAPTTAVSAHIDDEYYRPVDNWFHLIPGRSRRIELLPRSQSASAPSGAVTAVNCAARVHYRGAQ
jgi:beta-mannosidase